MATPAWQWDLVHDLTSDLAKVIQARQAPGLHATLAVVPRFNALEVRMTIGRWPGVYTTNTSVHVLEVYSTDDEREVRRVFEKATNGE